MVLLSKIHPLLLPFIVLTILFFTTNPIPSTGNIYYSNSTDLPFYLPMRGADVSFLSEIEDNGGKYYMKGVEEDLFVIFQHYGINSIRLRTWVNPVNGYSSKADTLALAKRATDLGMDLLLDFHYSDTWADPGKQIKPAAWTGYSFEELKSAVYNYTEEIILALRNQGSLPSMVQIGNEITPGMLWDDGRVGWKGSPFDNETQWIQFTELLKAGIQAVQDNTGGEEVKIMLHIDRGGTNTVTRWFFDNVIAKNVSFDVIGLSFYPWWHGTFEDLQENLLDISVRYPYEICIVETAYPWTLDWYDLGHNSIGWENQTLNGYPASVEGQEHFLFDLFSLVKNSTNSKGTGVYYWEPDSISAPTRPSGRENLGFFNFTGHVLESIMVFNQTNPLASTTSTLWTSITSTSETTDGFDIFSLLLIILIIKRGRKK
jgi:arabinogalactan endo-1,4-beta-galactosidase